jgi:hypothetical protein
MLSLPKHLYRAVQVSFGSDASTNSGGLLGGFGLRHGQLPAQQAR